MLDFDESLRAYKEHCKMFHISEAVQIDFSDELIEKLSGLWDMPKNEVLDRLKNTTK